MALKLIPLDEAARMLGVSVERLNHLRERQQIYGYRDGASWKFKQQDIERLGEDLRAQTVDVPISDGSSHELGDIDMLEGDPLASALSDSDSVELSLTSDTALIPSGGISTDSEDVVLLSDRELGASEPGTSSTIIGKPGKQSPEESDIRLVGPKDRRPGGSDVKLKVDTKAANESGLRLVVDPPIDVAPDAPTDLRIEDSDALDVLSDSGEDDLVIASPQSPTAKPLTPAPKPKHDSAELDLAGDDSDEEFAIAGVGKPAPAAPQESGISLGIDDLDDDLVLSSSGGSDVTLGSAADSGISLASPSDSGLSLEEPLELKSEDDSLELGGDEFAIAADPDSDSADVAPADDDFLLTPIEDALDSDASEDSGSQVIALDSDSGFGDSGLLEADGGGMLEEDFGEADAGQPLGAGLGGPALAAGGMAIPGMAAREVPYTLWNILGLVTCTLFLSLTGMMMFDLIRNMWSWDSPYGFNSYLMDLIRGPLGL